ncbi:MAG: hypothetical protein U0L09_09160 [Christensenellales bacterium]|nr:hypothetical protein [Christensenellales bacterium]
MQNRWKSKVLWISVAAQLVSLLMVLGMIDTGMGNAINGVVVSLCEMLVLFGVLNNPTDKAGF